MEDKENFDDKNSDNFIVLNTKDLGATVAFTLGAGALGVGFYSDHKISGYIKESGDRVAKAVTSYEEKITANDQRQVKLTADSVRIDQMVRSYKSSGGDTLNSVYMYAKQSFDEGDFSYYNRSNAELHQSIVEAKQNGKEFKENMQDSLQQATGLEILGGILLLAGGRRIYKSLREARKSDNQPTV